MPRKFVGSEEQVAIWKAVKGDVEHILIEARAGTGKTTTIVEACKQLPKTLDMFVCAFNTSARDDLKKRLPPTVPCSTLHGLGLRLLNEKVGKTKVVYDKTFEILGDLAPAFKINKWPRNLRYKIANLVGLCKSEGVIVPYDVKNGSTPTEILKEIWSVIDHHDVDTGEEEELLLQMTAAALRESLKNPNMIDFNDMIWIPYAMGLSPKKKYDLLLVDEVQDLNKTQLDLVLNSGNRIIAVGDRYQSIYGWRGADTEAIPRIERILSDSERGLKVLPLTICRRCPTKVIQLSQNLVEDIKPMKDMQEGSVTIKSQSVFDELSPGDMVQCRVNAPLVTLCYYLWARQKPAYLSGDLGKRIKSLVESFELKNLNDLYPCLAHYESTQRGKILSKYGEDMVDYKMATVRDMIECIETLAENSDTIHDFMSQIDRIFNLRMTAKEKDGLDFSKLIRLTSIHRAKGLEADRVFILCPEKLPLVRKNQNAWQIQEEKNLAYVAFTRSRSELVFIGSCPPIIGSQQLDEVHDK